MKNILYHLYHGNIAEAERSIKDLQKHEEFTHRNNAHEAFESTLSAEQKELFDKFYFADCGCSGLILERTYANGFKTGFL